jgi:hypothetical protein
MNALINPAAIPGHNSATPKLTDSQMKAIAQTMDKLADSLSAMVTPEMNEAVAVIVQARKDWQGGPFILLGFGKVTYGDKVLNTFPTPGVEVGECPDKYKVPYYRDGKLKFKATSFYLEFFKRTPAGQVIERDLAFIALAKDEKANKAAVPAHILAMSPVDLEALRTTLNKDKDSAVKAWRDALALHKQFEAVNALPHVEAAPQMDSKGNVCQDAKPIKVWNIDNPDKEWSLYSVGAFLLFDAAKASENGGTFEALKLTVKRDTEEGTAGSEVAPHIATNKTLSAFLLTVHEFIANKHLADKKRELYGLFLKDQINGAGSDQLVQAIRDLELWAKAILDIPSVQGRLSDIDQKAAA